MTGAMLAAAAPVPLRLPRKVRLAMLGLEGHIGACERHVERLFLARALDGQHHLGADNPAHLVDGFIEIMVGNLVREFAPDLRRGLHLHSIAAFIRAHSADDD